MQGGSGRIAAGIRGKNRCPGSFSMKRTDEADINTWNTAKMPDLIF